MLVVIVSAEFKPYINYEVVTEFTVDFSFMYGIKVFKI